MSQSGYPSYIFAGGGTGGYGDGGCGVAMPRSGGGLILRPSTADGGYGTGAGGCLAYNTDGVGGQGIIVLRYH